MDLITANTSLSDDVLFENKCNYTTMDDTLLSTTKNKSLKDYDRELKALKEENFSLKLRIYMLEEEKSEREDKSQIETNGSWPKTQTKANEQLKNELIKASSPSDLDVSSSASNSTLSSCQPTAPDTAAAPNRRRRRRRKQRDDDFYVTDDEQKEIELENLNRINLDLEKTIETLRADLKLKIQLIEANKREKESLQSRFGQFQVECERKLYDKLKEQFDSELTERLDQVNQTAFLKEKELNAKLAECESKLSELIDVVETKDSEIENLKQERLRFVKDYKETVEKQIMEKLIAKDSIIELKDAEIERNRDQTDAHPHLAYANLPPKSFPLLPSDEASSPRSAVVVETTPCVQLTRLLIASPPKLTTASVPISFAKKQEHHYQFIISDLENQLKLKESLLHKYILIVKDKDAQINQLINLGLLCNKDLVNAKKLESFIAGLQNNLNDKDHLFEKSLREHIDLVRQKDELIIQLRSANFQLNSDLDKANEILLESENRIEHLQNELLSGEEKRLGLECFLKQEIRKNQEIMADYKVELAEKDELVAKLRDSIETMKSRLKSNANNAEMVAFYEQQSLHKDMMITEFTAKIDKLTASLAEKVSSKEEQITKLKKETEEKLAAVLKENHQLRSELNRAHLELEKQEGQFCRQVDEYELEIKEIASKLKEKENTIKTLIQSAEEKDNLIVKLEQLVQSPTAQPPTPTSIKEMEETNANKARKIDGLMKLVQKKDQQIEELKRELAETSRLRSAGSSGSMQELDVRSSSSLLSLGTLQPASLSPPGSAPTVVIKSLIECLNKEIQIYKRLNSVPDKTKTLELGMTPTNMAQTLRDIENLRAQLLKMQEPVQSPRPVSLKKLTSSVDNIPATPQTPTADLASSSSSSSSYQWAGGQTPTVPITGADSGMESQKSETRGRPATRPSSIPRPVVPGGSPYSVSSSRSSPLASQPSQSSGNLMMATSSTTTLSDENVYSGYSRDELIALVRQLASENVILNRQFETKVPKLTELHNEVSSLRERLAEAARINDYLRKQIEIYHITHNNTESLLEMAHRFNLTKDQLELYKEKLAKIEELNESLLQQQQQNSRLLPGKTKPPAAPAFNATFENEIIAWKAKNQNLKNALDRSNRVCKYLSTLFAKYSPLFRNIGLANKSHLRRCLSEPQLTRHQDSNVSQELKRLSAQRLSNGKFDVLLSRHVSEAGGRKNLEAEIDIVRPSANSPELFQIQRVQLKCEQLERTIRDTSTLNRDYYLKLFNIYTAFKNLKANPKYLKQMFTEPLIESFCEHSRVNRVEENATNDENLVQSIFSGALVKFDELSTRIEEKDAEIRVLKTELDKMKILSPVDTSDDANSNFEFREFQPKSSASRVHESLSRIKANFEPIMSQIKTHVGEAKSNELLRWFETALSDLRTLESSILTSGNDQKLLHVENIDPSKFMENNTELKTKLKKYREEIMRLKEKIKSQNREVEDALQQLMVTNREKENSKLFLTAVQSESDSMRSGCNLLKVNPNFGNSEVTDNFLSEKLNKTHSKLKKARDNIQQQTRLDEQDILGKESMTSDLSYRN